ncbi:MAG: hypothetical protein JWR26_428 [Pedosphaera sp.]|nr:hypothetical protein [Pedosphaera sp.]
MSGRGFLFGGGKGVGWCKLLILWLLGCDFGRDDVKLFYRCDWKGS